MKPKTALRASTVGAIMLDTVYEIFEAARDAVRENASIRRRLERMAAAETRSGQGSAVRAGFIADRMAATDARVDFESATAKREAENWALVDAATFLLYGEDMAHGLAQALGLQYADAIWWRYLADSKWQTVADRCGCSVRTAQTRVQVGMDYIDSNGIDDTRAGVDNLR